MKIIELSFIKGRRLFDFCLAVLISVVCVFLSFSIMIHGTFSDAYMETVADATPPLIVIDAGHGGEDVGTVGVNGVYEKDLNLAIAFTLGEMLINEGYTVFYTRTEDKLLYTEEENIKGMRKIYDLKNRAMITNEKNPLMLISIHMNYFSIEKYHGFEAYYRAGDSASQSLAYAITSEVKLATDPTNERIPKATEDIYLLKNVTCPAVLLECGFLSNQTECEKLCEKEYQKQLCFSIICGMIKYENNNTEVK